MSKFMNNVVNFFKKPVIGNYCIEYTRSPGSLNEKIAANEKESCKVEFCDNNRNRRSVSGYCCAHSRQCREYGHPLHRRLTRNLYKYERRKCREVIEEDLASDFSILKTRYTVAFFDQWLEDAAASKLGTVEPEHFKRLKEASITGVDLLVECASVWLLSENSPERIFDHRHRTYCLGMKAIRLSPYGAKTYGREHKAVGEHIDKCIGIFLILIVLAVKEKEASIDEAFLKDFLDRCDFTILEGV